MNQEILTQELKPCPLCGTMLPYEKWLKVSGLYEEQQKYRKQLEEELNKAKEQSRKLKEEYKNLREKEKQIRNEYQQKLKHQQERIKQIYIQLKEKEKSIRSELEQKFKLQQEKLQIKFEKEKQKILAEARKEGIKIGTEKEKAKTEKFKAELEKLKQDYNMSIQKLKERYQRQTQIALQKLEKEKQRELKRVRIEGFKEGIEKQRARTEKVEKMLENLRKARDEAIQRAKQLEEMIKKGTTPQIEGFDFEKELTNQLKQRFPEDEIKPTGKEGDIIQTVHVESKEVGKIIYECKKTKEFQNSYVQQIQRDKAKVVADYGVIVTWASKENKQGFWVEQDIIVVHPYGVLDVATILRETLVQMYTLKLSKEEFETKGKAILEFMQSEEFRSRIHDTIAKSKEAYEILKKEVKTHVNTWKKRFKIYESINKNTNVIQATIKHILLHGKIPEKLPEAKEFPAFPISIKDTETPDAK